KVLKTKKDLRSFIGSVTYLKEYIPYYAEILKPLTMMLPSKAKFVWSKEAETAAKQVVEVLELNTRLEHVREDKDLHLFTDASDVGIGGALLQFDRDDKDFERQGVITFMSKTLTSQEAGHTTTEKEAYAIFYCISKAEYHLRGRPFTLHTDHQNLMFVKTRSSAKVERWRTFLSDFTFDTVHIKGRKNQLADALSRLGHKVVKVKKIPNDEHDADLMRHRTNHVKASRKPLKESDDCPLVKIKGINDKTKEP
ncbi:hypothetical protein ADUPG1_004074, partial [Aduncisulcus paluster]